MTTVHVIWWHGEEHTQHDLELHVESDAEIKGRVIALCGAEEDKFIIDQGEAYEAH